MSELSTMRSWLTKAARTHVYAAGAGALYAAATIKLFWFSDASFVTAASGIYGGMAFPTAAFIATAIGLSKIGPQPGPNYQAHGGDHGRS